MLFRSPRSCVKPKYQGKVMRTIRSLMGDRQAHTFRGPVMVGFRDVSRNLEFNSSYTLLEHAPEDSIELEIRRVLFRSRSSPASVRRRVRVQEPVVMVLDSSSSSA